LKIDLSAHTCRQHSEKGAGILLKKIQKVVIKKAISARTERKSDQNFNQKWLSPRAQREKSDQKRIKMRNWRSLRAKGEKRVQRITKNEKRLSPRARERKENKNLSKMALSARTE
jgi:hypothetical protein